MSIPPRVAVRISVAFVAFLLFLASPARAQIGTSTEIIAGRVVGPNGQALSGVRIDVTSVETRVVKHTTSREDGRFSVLFRDGGAQYRLQATAIGMLPAAVTLTRQADEDRLIAEIRMSASAVELSAVQIRASNAARGAAPAGGASPGGLERALPPQLLERLPVTPGDMAAIAALSPGVVAVAGTDSTPKSFSVAGQPASGNNVTVDGASFLFGSVPQDAVRGVRVVTNAYDPSRGQFTGGQVATTTRAGTSDIQGSVSTTFNDRHLQSAPNGAPTFDPRFTQGGFSGALGGPLVADRAFYFVSAQLDHRMEGVASLLSAAPGTLTNLGVNPDSASRLFSLLQARGLAATLAPVDERTTTTVSSLARVDWDFADNHSLMFRGDWRHTDQTPTRLSLLGAPSTAGTSQSHGGGLMATVTSSLGNFINEGRAYVAASHDQADPRLTAPLGVVNVVSDAAGGARSAATLQFGGSSAVPRDTRSSLFEISDELSFLRGTAHRLKAGGLLNATKDVTGAQPNQNGMFVYNSLADLEADKPALFARTLNAQSSSAGSMLAGLYVGDAWRATPSLQIVYGGRFERWLLAGAPAANPALETALGIRTNRWPSSNYLSPRLGFTYILGNTAGVASGIIRGGAGRFVGKVPGPVASLAGTRNGLTSGQIDLWCVGSDVPAANWQDLVSQSSAIPSTCNSQLASTQASTNNVLALSPDFGAPSVWRASLGVNRRLFGRFATGLDALIATGEGDASAIDVNLPSSGFQLASEGNRPVVSSASSIDARTGTPALAANRQHTEFGQALLVGSSAKSQTAQVTASVVGPGVRSGFTSLSYTYTRSRDQSNGFGLGRSIPTTAGDPNRLEWGTSDLEVRHQGLATIMVPFPRHFDVTLLTRVNSGTGYTPMVSRDINGDGARNDRAFVFNDPTSADPRVASLSQQIASLIASTDRGASSCLAAQLGQIASRNSCRTPWSSTADIQLNWNPPARQFDDRLTLSFTASNALVGADHLLHGSGARGWGQIAIPDRTLLTVVGFDPSAREYQYAVNQHFGSSIGQRSAVASPFMLTIRARYLLGVDPSKTQLRALTGGTDGRTASLQDVKSRLGKGLPYPVKTLLASADSAGLQLSDAQRASLASIEVQYEAKLDTLVTEAAEILVAAGPRPDPAVISPKLQANSRKAIQAVQDVVASLKGVLSAEQWAKTPEKVRYPLAQPAQGGRPPQ